RRPAVGREVHPPHPLRRRHRRRSQDDRTRPPGAQSRPDQGDDDRRGVRATTDTVTDHREGTKEHEGTKNIGSEALRALREHRGFVKSRRALHYAPVLDPAATRAMPPATAAMPTIGESGMVLCFSVVASIGPMSSTFSRLV